MKEITRIFAVFLLVSIFFLPFSLSQGLMIGINNYHIEVGATIGKSVPAYIAVLNPSPYAFKARVYFDCDNCKSDLYFFGTKIGEIIEDPYQLISIDKKEVYVPPNTMGDGIPITITLTPKLILIKYLRLYTPESINFLVRLINPDYPGSFDLPYPSLFLGDRTIRGRIVVNVYESTFGAAGVTPAMASTYIARVKGMPLGSLLIILLGIIFVVWVINKKTKFLKKSKKLFSKFMKKKKR